MSREGVLRISVPFQACRLLAPAGPSGCRSRHAASSPALLGHLVEALVLGIDPETRRISLSIKEVGAKKKITEEEGPDKVRLEAGQVLRGIVEDVKPYGLFIRLPQFGRKVRGLLPNEELRASEKGYVKKKFPRGREIQVEIVSIDEKGKIRLSQRAMEEREDREDYEKFLKKEDRSGKLGTLGDVFKNLRLEQKETKD